MTQACEITNAPELIFSCCGATDVGELTDRVACKLNKDSEGKMYCLSGLGAELESFVNHTKTASKILVLDGSPADCAKKIVEKNGFTQYEFIRMTDLGYRKGKTDITDQMIETVALEASVRLKEKTNAY